MSDGFMIWFLRGEPTGRVVDHLTGTGATLAYPIGEDRVSVFDLEGTQEIVSHKAFMPLLEDNTSRSLTFQMRYSHAMDQSAWSIGTPTPDLATLGQRPLHTL